VTSGEGSPHDQKARNGFEIILISVVIIEIYSWWWRVGCS